MPRQLLTLVARSLPCLTVTLPWAGGVTSRTAGRGPAVQSLRMVAKIPALMFVSGLPLTSRWTVASWAAARIGKASSRPSAPSIVHCVSQCVGHFIGLASNCAWHLWAKWVPGIVGDLDQQE